MVTNIYTSHHEYQREEILEVAKDLFSDKSIEQISIGHVTKAVQLTRTTIFQYFGSKEELAQGIFKDITQSGRGI